jgi:hypothetical protein
MHFVLHREIKISRWASGGGERSPAWAEAGRVLGVFFQCRDESN